MAKKAGTKRATPAKQVSPKARTARVLDGMVKRLRRLSTRRASKDVKQAYRDAADLIKKVTPKK